MKTKIMILALLFVACGKETETHKNIAIPKLTVEQAKVSDSVQADTKKAENQDGPTVNENKEYKRYYNGDISELFGREIKSNKKKILPEKLIGSWNVARLSFKSWEKREEVKSPTIYKGQEASEIEESRQNFYYATLRFEQGETIEKLNMFFEDSSSYSVNFLKYLEGRESLNDYWYSKDDENVLAIDYNESFDQVTLTTTEWLNSRETVYVYFLSKKKGPDLLEKLIEKDYYMYGVLAKARIPVQTEIFLCEENDLPYAHLVKDAVEEYNRYLPEKYKLKFQKRIKNSLLRTSSFCINFFSNFRRLKSNNYEVTGSTFHGHLNLVTGELQQGIIFIFANEESQDCTYSTLLHEMGHLLGLHHTFEDKENHSLMQYDVYDFQELQPRDIKALQNLYGKP
jgi:hypothetical protein